MAKKPSLTAALQQASGRSPVATLEPPVQDIEDSRAAVPSRVGKKTIAGHFDPAVSRQLRQIALEEDTSVQDLLREALNDLFAKRGKSQIA